MPLHFSSKDFEILDLDPPNNPTSHYGACHFGYSLALRALYPPSLFSIVVGGVGGDNDNTISSSWKLEQKQVKNQLFIIFFLKTDIA